MTNERRRASSGVAAFKLLFDRQPAGEFLVRIRLFLTTAAIIAAMAVLSSQSDLDGLMSQVLERRDDNWKKRQQYTLDEESTFRLLGPMETPLYGAQREYVWFPREGFFIRSPRKADGVEIGEAERRRAEEAWLKREREKETRRAKQKDGLEGQNDTGNATDIPDVIRQTIEPEFVQAAVLPGLQVRERTLRARRTRAVAQSRRAPRRVLP